MTKPQKPVRAWFRNRLKALAHKGKSQKKLAEVLGVARPRISEIVSGKRNIKSHEVRAIAEYLELPEATVLSHLSDRKRPAMATVALVGYVGAGAVVIPFDDQGALDYIEAPPGASGDDVVAVVVRGNSMWPAYRDGDLIYYMTQPTIIDTCAGQDCVVQLDDGRMLLKTVTRGSEPGTWTLIAHNDAPIENVILAWAAPVQWVRKAQRS